MFVHFAIDCICFFFFFKQKTAYEMRISDWSSDVCSSDLAQARQRIALQNPGLARKVLRFVASADLRRLKCLCALSTADPLILPPFSPSPKAELEALAATLEAYAAELDEAADAEGRDRLILESASVTDRAAVADRSERRRGGEEWGGKGW